MLLLLCEVIVWLLCHKPCSALRARADHSLAAKQRQAPLNGGRIGAWRQNSGMFRLAAKSSLGRVEALSYPYQCK
jgi:hypothetical protein